MSTFVEDKELGVSIEMDFFKYVPATGSIPKEYDNAVSFNFTIKDEHVSFKLYFPKKGKPTKTVDGVTAYEKYYDVVPAWKKAGYSVCEASGETLRNKLVSLARDAIFKTDAGKNEFMRPVEINNVKTWPMRNALYELLRGCPELNKFCKQYYAYVFDNTAVEKEFEETIDGPVEIEFTYDNLGTPMKRKKGNRFVNVKEYMKPNRLFFDASTNGEKRTGLFKNNLTINVDKPKRPRYSFTLQMKKDEPMTITFHDSRSLMSPIVDITDKVKAACAMASQSDAGNKLYDVIFDAIKECTEDDVRFRKKVYMYEMCDHIVLYDYYNQYYSYFHDASADY